MTAISLIPPGLPLVLGALLLPLCTARLRALLVLGLPLLVIALVWQLPAGAVLTLDFLGYELAPLSDSKLGRLFATVFAIMAFAGGLFGLNHMRVAELSAALLSAGCAISIAFAGDLVTLLVFWEGLALASTLLVWLSLIHI